MADAIDPAQAETAFNQLQPELNKLKPSDLRNVSVEVQDAAVVALGLAQRDNASPRKERFEGLAGTAHFDLALLEGLSNLALAAWHGISVIEAPVRVSYHGDLRVSHFRPFVDFWRNAWTFTCLIALRLLLPRRRRLRLSSRREEVRRLTAPI